MSLRVFLNRLESSNYVFVWRKDTLLYEGWVNSVMEELSEAHMIDSIKFLNDEDIEIIIK